MQQSITISLLLLLLLFQASNLALAQQPNIILIMADDLGYETLECNGGASYVTPNLNELAAAGVRFSRAYATPLCTPSRVQIMTGKYNFRNYVRFGLLDQQEKTFANLLKDAGYATAIAGKWQLDGGEESPYHFGFDEYALWQIRSGDFWYRYKDPKVYKNGSFMEDNQGRYGPDVYTDFLLDFMKRKAGDGQPFFAYYPM
jgi:arylsulfatase A